MSARVWRKRKAPNAFYSVADRIAWRKSRCGTRKRSVA